MKKEEWKLMGVVGVDSGQLLITDPCYIDSSWEEKDVNFKDRFIDTRTGEDVKSPRKIKGGSFEHEFEKGMTYNQALEKGILKGVEDKPTEEFNYDGCCKKGSKSFISLKYPLGHKGIGVCFNSGLGDGTYEVWGLIKEYKGWGKRIKEVKIKLMED